MNEQGNQKQVYEDTAAYRWDQRRDDDGQKLSQDDHVQDDFAFAKIRENVTLTRFREWYPVLVQKICPNLMNVRLLAVIHVP